jgi:hypothetical protein
MVFKGGVAGAALLAMSSTLVESREPLCVADRAAMPAEWRPSAKLEEQLDPKPWSTKETDDAAYAIRTGLNQMIRYYHKHPKAVSDLWDDAVQSLVEVSYSGSNMPEVQAISRNAARENLSLLIDPLLKRSSETATCDDFESTLPLTIYAHSLLDKDDPRKAAMVEFTNAANEECGSLRNAMNADYRAVLKKNADTETIFNLVIWSTWLTEAQLVPDLEIPDGAAEFPPALWRYWETFPLTNASKFKAGAHARKFRRLGYLATHIAFIPTGYQRHPIYIGDSPKLYRFMRENFYALMEAGETDLFAQFLDTLRQYGCDEESDQQIRDGTRYLLKVFQDYNDNWMAYKEPNLAEEDVTDYDRIHRAWSGIAGVRKRVPEPPEPGTYGAIIRRWLPIPR